MKLNDHFRNFLSNTVNLNTDRFNKLDSSIDSIETFINNSSWGPEIIGFEPHGSWAHKTIIKPVANSPFDADLLVNIKQVIDWTPKQYINELAKIFRASATYADKITTSSHCVTITYVGDRKIDVAPCLVNRGGWVSREVCNRISDEFEPSAPTEYTNWLISRNDISKKNSFRKVTKLLKYLRDIKKTFTCSSVLLTTLLGQQIYDNDQDTDNFIDTPSSLKTIITRLDSYLQMNVTKPAVLNPFLVTENFADQWSDDQYSNFRSMIHKYKGWIDEAYDADTRKTSIELWRKIFGDDFANDVVLTEGKNVSDSARKAIVSLAKASTSMVGDLVSLVRQFGKTALPPGFDQLPYKHEPEWMRAGQTFAVRIIATLHKMEQSPSIRDVASLEPVPKNHGLWFDVRDAQGQEVSSALYRVQWRITNTDEEAFNASCMRGEFNPPKIGNRRWEELAYRGVHMVEAFVINRASNQIVAESAPFYVTVE